MYLSSVQLFLLIIVTFFLQSGTPKSQNVSHDVLQLVTVCVHVYSECVCVCAVHKTLVCCGYSDDSDMQGQGITVISSEFHVLT